VGVSRSELLKWIGTEGSWEKIQPSLAAATALAQKEGAQKIALFGFCWGGTQDPHTHQRTRARYTTHDCEDSLFGFACARKHTTAKMAWHAAQDGSTYAAAAFIHPSFFTPDDAKLLQVPIINLPTKDDPDMVPCACACAIRRRGSI